MTDLFDVIADAARRDILRLLLKNSAQGAGEVSVSDIVAATGMSQPTVSKHLKVLREASLVAVREDGAHRLYHLNADPLEALEKWVVPFLGTPTQASTAAKRSGASTSDENEGNERPLGAAPIAAATTAGRTAADLVHTVTSVWRRFF